MINMRCYDRQTTQLLFLDARVCSLHIFTYRPKYLVLNSEDPFPSENGFYKVILDPIMSVILLVRIVQNLNTPCKKYNIRLAISTLSCISICK